VITTRHLTKKFGKLTAVDDLGLDIPEGEVFGLLGPNGAGKTTTINLLITLLKPTSGTATVNGIDVVKRPAEVRKNIGVVFQEPSVDDLLSGKENLEMHAMLYGMPGELRRRRVEEVLELVELTDRKDDWVKTYSGGMRRRLELARGLMHHPKVLFLDEPTLGLDPQTREHIWKYIARLAKEERTTIVMTTHYMEEADLLCSRIGIMDHGKIVALGTPKKLKHEVGGDWYFDVSKFRKYGMLSRMRRRPGKGRRISFDDYYKWQAGDFILWRRWRKPDGGVYWNTRIGKGRPGWSIECTAMGRKFLGDRFDVKMGGADNIFCHHENEIAQGWGASGKIFAKYFIHVKHLLINGKKMSKSLGNAVYLDDLERRGIEPGALRLFYLTAHYRRRMSFTWEKAKRAQESFGECRACVRKLKAARKAGEARKEVYAAVGKARRNFERAMDDDFQTQKAHDAACALVRFANGRKRLRKSEAALALSAMRDFDRVFGLGLF